MQTYDTIYRLYLLNILSLIALLRTMNLANSQTSLLELIIMLVSGDSKDADVLAEQEVHFLEGNTLGLGDEQIRKSERDKSAGSEEVKDTKSDGLDHVRQRVDDHELGEPLHADRKHHTEGTDAVGQDFRGNDPGNTVPGETVKDGVNINHGNGGVGARVLGWDLVEGAAELGVYAKVEHGYGSADSTNKQGWASAEFVHDEYHEDHCRGHFDQSIDTSGEELDRGTGETDGLEDGGRVVVDGVDSIHY